MYTYQENIANMFGTLTQVSYPIIGVIIVWILIVISIVYIYKITNYFRNKKRGSDGFEDFEEEDDNEEEYD